MSTATALAAGTRSRWGKPALWTILGLAFVSVLAFTEYPTFSQANPHRTKLYNDRYLLIPHAVLALTAMLIGPFQFSTRFRQRHLRTHRLMGRVYVASILITAPIALVLGLGSADSVKAFGNGVMAALWFLCTVCAFLTVRNRQITGHRQWMVRSYLFTLTFIFTRVANPIPSWFNMSDEASGGLFLFFSLLYLFFADVGFNWRELTRKKA
jgi:uncharacterized membrane protein